MTGRTESPQQPTLPKLFAEALRGLQLDLHTALPGVVQSYDPNKQTADIQPCIKRKKLVKEIFVVGNLPLISDVPIIFPRTKKAFIHFPLEPGDTVLLVFCERSLEQWRTLGGIVDPKDNRMHNLSDAVAFPGFYADNELGDVDNPDALTLKYGLGKIELFKDGKSTIGNGQVEIVDQLIQLIDALTSAITNTAIGPQPLVQPLFAAIKSQLELIKGG